MAALFQNTRGGVRLGHSLPYGRNDTPTLSDRQPAVHSYGQVRDNSGKFAMPAIEPDDDDIQLSMLENGLDFILSGLKYIGNPTSKFDLKYAVLHLSSGIELVLKDRLRREDWTQIFVKPEQATEEKLKSGNFKSVNLYQCLERLEKHTAVNLPDIGLLDIL